jgi:uncharacterized protein (TIGR03083 family)
VTVTDGIVSAFRTAGEWFADLAGRDDVALRWGDPSALSGYSIGGLVGHVTAAIAWLGPLLDTANPGGSVPVWSVGRYLAPFPVRRQEDLDGPLHRAARTQGERSAQRGPKETVTRSAERFDAVATRLAAENLDRVIDLRPTLPGAIRLDDFIRTRVVELVVHGDDLAVSVGVPPDPPVDGTAIATDALVALAVHTHRPIAVVRALARPERSNGTVFPVL